jgi:hypothetical protein
MELFPDGRKTIFCETWRLSTSAKIARLFNDAEFLRISTLFLRFGRKRRKSQAVASKRKG